MKRIAQTCACVVALVLFEGCRDEGTRVPVSGTVTQNGQPIREGKITFAPAQGTSGPAAGASIENGRYQIPASEGPGTGDYVISVTPGAPPRKRLPMGQQSEAAPAASESFRFTRRIDRDNGSIDLELPASDEAGGDG